MARRSHDPFVDEQSLQHQLQRKSRRRRKDLLQLAKASAAPQKRRNDPERKTRKYTPAHVREVMGSVSAFGFCVPILVGKGNLVVDGETCIEAAKALGLTTVPCIRIDGRRATHAAPCG